MTMLSEAVGRLASGTIEYQHWGVSALTISFFISLVLTAVTGWGLVQQNKTIWRAHTAEAVSVLWMVYIAVLHVAIFLYGISIHSLALMINGILALCYLPILLGLWKFKGFTTLEKMFSVGLIMAITAMALFPYKASLFFAFSIGGLLSAMTQPLEMWRKKSALGLNIKLIGTLILGNVVWFIYGVAVTDWVLITINAAAFLIFATTIYLWQQYRQKIPQGLPS